MEINFPQNSPEWQSIRWQSLGASDMPGAIGLSRFVTAQHLLKNKRLREKAPPVTMTQAMQDGHDHEERVSQLFSHNFMPNKIVKVWTPTMYKSRSIDWLTCSPDRFIDWKNTPFDGQIVEIKLKTNTLVLPKIPSVDYLIQVHAQMKVMEQHNYCFITYGLKNNLSAVQIWRLKFNENFWDKTIYPRSTEFWAKRNLPDDATDEQLQLSYRQEFYDYDPARISSTFSPMLIYQRY